MNTVRWLGTVGIALCLSPCSFILAQDNDLSDRIVLKSGGELVGTITSESQEDGKNFVVFETESGGILKLDKNRLIRKIIPADGLASEYHLRATSAASPAQHWKMVEWCEQQPKGKSRFKGEIDFHLHEIVAADPNDKRAWQKLGYVRRNGVWSKDKKMFAVSGYTKVGRSWISNQLAGVDTQLEQADQAKRDGVIAFNAWKKSVRKVNAITAKANLLSIIQPAVVLPLYDFSREHRDVGMRRLAVEAIGKVDSPVAMNALINFAIQDPDISVRQAAATELENQPHFLPEQVAAMVAGGGFLQHAENRIVERAGQLLGQVPSDAAILPLINALQTSHKVSTGRGQGRTSVQSVGGNIQGLDTGGGPTTVDQISSNQSVAGALRAITGQEFGFNEPLALAWYIENYAYTEMELRGDDN